MVPPRKLGLAALLGLGLAGCTSSDHRDELARETQLRAVARDLLDGMARLPQGMVLYELTEPLRGADPDEDRPVPQGKD